MRILAMMHIKNMHRTFFINMKIVMGMFLSIIYIYMHV